MKKHHLLGVILLCSGLFSCSSGVIQQANYEVIPLPQEIKITTGSFVLNDRTSIVYPKDNKEMQQNANLLAKYIHQMSGKKLKVIDEPVTSNAIILATGLNADNAEAYQLKVTQDNVTITGTSEAGTFYGIQTLRKSLPITNKGDISLPAAEINDYPRFSYRGVHLDVSRHFFPADSVKRFIDMMALHNMNRFHWHITEDQGWRLEIKKYPKLTEIGSKRTETVIGRNSGEYDGKPYGGFYTQEQAKEIVAYAAERYITVIPEIDLPGHMQAALAAYPELGCTGGPYEVWRQWGVSEDVLCAGNDQVLKFLEDVYGELIEIFPSPYIHVGGDEVAEGAWSGSPLCMQLMKEKGMTQMHDLAEYFITRVSECLQQQGISFGGWQEAALGHRTETHAALAPRSGGIYCWSTVAEWGTDEISYQIANNGYPVILCNVNNFYLDLAYDAHTDEPGHFWAGYVDESKSFSMLPYRVYRSSRTTMAGRPVSPDSMEIGKTALTALGKQRIKGVQAQLFAETIRNYQQVEYYTFPKIMGLAERGWNAHPVWENLSGSTEAQAYEQDLLQFYRKISRKEMPHWVQNGIHFRLPYPGLCLKDGKLYANTSIREGQIRYTTDGTEPMEDSPLWETPIDCQTEVVKAKLFYLGKESMTAVLEQ